jgi:Flp pilus assembly protein TadD
MKIRLMKFGVLFGMVLAAILIYRFGPKRENEKGAARSAAPAASTRGGAMSADDPGKDAHEAKVLEMALTKKPGHTPVLMKLAKLEEDKGNLDEATRHLQQIVKSEPGNYEARLELGRVYFQRGNIQGALDETQAILKAQPQNADALYNLGAIYGNLGNAGLAREYWGRLISFAPDSESGKRARQMMAQLPPVSR